MAVPSRNVLAGLAVTAVGLAHFAWPVKFEPLNRKLGFTRNTRTHVYINGGLEAALGLILISAKARNANIALSVAYPIYLTLNALRARRPRRLLTPGHGSAAGAVTPG